MMFRLCMYHNNKVDGSLERRTVVVHTSEDRKVRVHRRGEVTKSLWRGESQGTAYELAQAIHAIEAVPKDIRKGKEKKLGNSTYLVGR
jgi:Lhr-like helicase